MRIICINTAARLPSDYKKIYYATTFTKVGSPSSQNGITYQSYKPTDLEDHNYRFGIVFGAIVITHMVYLPDEGYFSSHLTIGSTKTTLDTEEMLGFFGNGYNTGYITKNTPVLVITSSIHTELAMLPRFGIYCI